MNPFRIFTSLRYDARLRAAEGNPAFRHAGWNHARNSACYMLDFHRDRMLRAATHWQWDKAKSVLAGEQGFKQLEAFIEEHVRAQPGGESPRRVRVLVNEEGDLRAESVVETDKDLKDLFPDGLGRPEALGGAVFVVVLDEGDTQRSEYTHYKTTKRDMYNAARERAGIKLGEAKEVLIAGGDGVVMEGSITTPFFWRGGRWVTPTVAPKYELGEGCGGQDGTTRRWALESGYAVEEAVPTTSLTDGELIWLSNGAKGFMLGKFEGRSTEQK